MRIDTAYLKQMVPFTGTAVELAQLLTSIGIEIEGFFGDDKGVLEFEITPNRPDWLSHYGVARELAAKQPGLTFTPFNLPEVNSVARHPFRIVIEDAADCCRYTGAIIRNVKVKPSAPWLQALIERLGMRPINNVVDISNLVMLTCGHPIHIFDLRTLEKDEVRIRRARAGEKLVLLDGKEVELGADNLVIADGKKAVAMAGIMGSLDSGVTETTRHIFIESAYFHPPLIRKTCRALGLKSDASYRFERGMDMENTVTALRLAVKWLAEDQGSGPDLVFYQDEYPLPPKPPTIRLDKSFPDALTGIMIAPETCVRIMQKLGFTVSERSGHWDVTVPPFRVDVAEREDLVEEIIRIHGYDHLGSELPPHAGVAVVLNQERSLEKEISQHLVAQGFHEVINYVFQATEDNRPFQEEARNILLKNPLGRDFSVMKASLLPGLLRNCAYNLNQNLKRIMVFEQGKVFSRNDGPREKKNLALGVTGEYLRRDWRTQPCEFDFFAFRTLLDGLFRRMRWEGEWTSANHPFFDPACCFDVCVQGRSAGIAGMVKEDISRAYGIEKPVFAAEFDIERLFSAVKGRGFRMWNRYPATTRDFSFLMDKTVTFAQLAATIHAVKLPELEGFVLVDVFEGQKLPAGKVSLSLSFTYRSGEKTLTTEEANDIHQRLTEELKKRLSLCQR